MGLLLQQTTSRGITANYHRLSEIHADFTLNKLFVKVASYVTADYRHQEISFNVELKELKDLRQELDELNLIPTEDNEERRIELDTKIKASPLAQVPSDAIRDLTIYERVYELTLLASDKMTRAELYEQLKELPEFENATDV